MTVTYYKLLRGDYYGDYFTYESFDGDDEKITCYKSLQTATVEVNKRNKEIRDKHRKDYEKRIKDILKREKQAIAEHEALVQAGLKEASYKPDYWKPEYDPLPTRGFVGEWVARPFTLEILE